MKGKTEMKNCFIINSAAGKTSGMKQLAAELRTTNHEFKIYRTKGPMDATRFIRKYCTEHPDERIRFYACGGDGTLKEVVNGVVGFENAEVGCYPGGSGNDFVKYYGGKERFMNVDQLINAPTVAVDLIRMGDEYSVNVINCGFDTYACKTMNEIKKKPVIGGKNAYYSGVVKSLACAMETNAYVYADGELLNEDGKLLLCTAANGRYYGGSFLCAPRAENDDGLIELCLVKPISRAKFVTLVGSYKSGNHLTDPRFAEYIVYRRCKKVEFVGDENFAITVDGELIQGSSFSCEIVPEAVKFALPPMKS